MLDWESPLTLLLLFLTPIVLVLSVLAWMEIQERKSRRQIAELLTEYFEAIGRDRIAEEEEANRSGQL